MHYTIYKVTNKMTGKTYIGSHKTKNLDDGYMGSGKYLKRAIEKYGIENFHKEILFVYDNPEAMYKKEKELVNKDFLTEENTYNLKVGGFGGFDYINQQSKNIYGNNGKLGYGGENLKIGWNRVLLEKEKKKISATLKEKYACGALIPSFLNKKHNEETKRKISEKNKISQGGEKNSQYGSKWIHNPLTKESKKIKGEVEDGWFLGKYKSPKPKVISKREQKINQTHVLYNNYHQIYDKLGFEKFVEVTGYTKSKQNLVQMLSKHVESFVPQNGKKR